MDSDWPGNLAADRELARTGGFAMVRENALLELPREEMPQDEMAPEVAYHLIQDELVVESTPSLNLGTFVTTCMENEAKSLMIESLSKNLVNHESYQVTIDIEKRCVNMIARLFNAPQAQSSGDVVGTSTLGSSEAIMLATLAMKKRWANRRKAAGKDYSSPNLIMSSAVHVCWKKAARYFDIEERYVYCTEDRFVIDPAQAVGMVDENTIGICSILGTTYTGEYEDTKAINDMLIQRDLDVPIHVDAASGGFVAPFLNPDFPWDFRLEKVASINTSGHKYGLVYAGIGWVVWRDAEYLPKELIFNINYLGIDQASFTLNFSRGASHVIAQYYKLVRLGRSGYRRIMADLSRKAEYLKSNLGKTGHFIVLAASGHCGLPLVTFRVNPTRGHEFDEFALANKLQRQSGWVVPAYTMAPHGDTLNLLRIVVREDLSYAHCDALIIDIQNTLSQLIAASGSGLLLQTGKHISTNSDELETRADQVTWTQEARVSDEKNSDLSEGWTMYRIPRVDAMRAIETI